MQGVYNVALPGISVALSIQPIERAASVSAAIMGWRLGSRDGLLESGQPKTSRPQGGGMGAP